MKTLDFKLSFWGKMLIAFVSFVLWAQTIDAGFWHLTINPLDHSNPNYPEYVFSYRGEEFVLSNDKMIKEENISYETRMFYLYNYNSEHEKWEKASNLVYVNESYFVSYRIFSEDDQLIRSRSQATDCIRLIGKDNQLIWPLSNGKFLMVLPHVMRLPKLGLGEINYHVFVIFSPVPGEGKMFEASTFRPWNKSSDLFYRLVKKNNTVKNGRPEYVEETTGDPDEILVHYGNLRLIFRSDDGGKTYNRLIFKDSSGEEHERYIGYDKGNHRQIDMERFRM